MAPDGTEAITIYGRPEQDTIPGKFKPVLDNPSPWISYAFDANDLAENHPNASTVPTDHYNTPASAEIDALGRTTTTTTRNVKAGSVEEITVENTYDIRGNVLSIKDPLGRTSVTTIYDYANQALKTTSIDTNDDVDPLLPGSAKVIYNAAGQVLETYDTSGSKSLSVFDELGRPIAAFAKDNSGQDFTLRSKVVYGDDANSGLNNPVLTNHLGRAYKAYDEAGVVTNLEYDFKGNLLHSNREVIADSELLNATDYFICDWSPGNEPALDAKVYKTSTALDGLNRPIVSTLPLDQNSQRKHFQMTYNRAGGIQDIKLDGTTYLETIKYNSRGQRIFVAMGNGLMTRSIYDEKTGHLLRTRTEKYILSGDTYTPQSGTSVQDNLYHYDLGGNIIKHEDPREGTGAGLGAHTNTLERNFEYDAIYRLLSATGRESVKHTGPPIPGTGQTVNAFVPELASNQPYSPGSSASKDTQTYTQSYQYDVMGNIQSLTHAGGTGNNFTRNYNYQTGNDKLSNITIGSNTYSFNTYDAVGNLTQRGDHYYYFDAANMLRGYKLDDGTTVSKHSHHLYSGEQRVKKLYKKQNGDYDVTVYVGPFEHRYQVRNAVVDKEQNLIRMEGLAELRVGDKLDGDLDNTTLYFLQDVLSSVTVTLSDTGALLSKQEYYPFGETSYGSYSKKRYMFTDKEKDDCSGLCYYGARFYAPWTCKFISVDPIYNPAESPYAYASNNPVMMNDPTGMQSASVGGNKPSGGGGTSGADTAYSANTPAVQDNTSVKFSDGAYLQDAFDAGNLSEIEQYRIAAGILLTGVVPGSTSGDLKKIPGAVSGKMDLIAGFIEDPFPGAGDRRHAPELADKMSGMLLEALFSDDPSMNAKAIDQLHQANSIAYNLLDPYLVVEAAGLAGLLSKQALSTFGRLSAKAIGGNSTRTLSTKSMSSLLPTSSSKSTSSSKLGSSSTKSSSTRKGYRVYSDKPPVNDFERQIYDDILEDEELFSIFEAPNITYYESSTQKRITEIDFVFNKVTLEIKETGTKGIMNQIQLHKAVNEGREVVVLAPQAAKGTIHQALKYHSVHVFTDKRKSFDYIKSLHK